MWRPPCWFLFLLAGCLLPGPWVPPAAGGRAAPPPRLPLPPARRRALEHDLHARYQVVVLGPKSRVAGGGRGQRGTQWRTRTLPAPDCACSCGEAQCAPSGVVGGGLRSSQGPSARATRPRWGPRWCKGCLRCVLRGEGPRLGGPLRGDARWGCTATTRHGQCDVVSVARM
jgi:hypothetical protein